MFGFGTLLSTESLRLVVALVVFGLLGLVMLKNDNLM